MNAKTKEATEAGSRSIPFQTIPNACKTTGLSKYYLRKGCKEGTIPHVMSGDTVYINVPALLKQLGVENWS